MSFAEIIARAVQAYQPPQPEQPAPEENLQLGILVSEATMMQQDIEDATARCLSLECFLTTLQSESESLLRQDAAPAMDSLLVLVHHIEALHQVTQDQRMSALTNYRDPTSAFGAIQVCTLFVNECKSQSRVVFGHFRSLSEKARQLTEKFSELATEFTFEVTSAQTRIERLQDITQTAETLRNGVENQRESWHGQKATAEQHVEQARATIRSAERKRDSVESARVVRNILTFGLGEVFDFFDLNEEIEGAERMVAGAKQNVQECEQSIQRAVAALQRINDQVVLLNALGDTVFVQEMMLEESVRNGQALRTHTVDLTNASMDVSLFVGKLAARSETFAVQHTAQGFAQSVLSFGRLMTLEGALNGLLVERDPGALQETLDMIAHSDGDDGVARDGWVIEGRQAQFEIEDLM